jgi:hypothetical protein
MEPGQICALNETRGCFLGLHVVAGDFPLASFQDWLATLTPNSGAGMWMAPFRGLPASEVQAPLDLLYLDVTCRVLEPVEFFPTTRVSPSTPSAASVLALPTHSIFSSQTQAGDQLILCNAEEMEWRLERLLQKEAQAASAPTANPSSALGPVLVRDESKPSARSALIRELAARTIEPVEIEPVKIDPVTVDPLPVEPVRIPDQSSAAVVLPAAPQISAPQPEPEQQGQPELTPQTAQPSQQPQTPVAKPWMDPARQEPARSPLGKLGKWLFSEPADPRRTSRLPVSGLVAHFFTGGAPQAHEVRDVSATGLFVVTKERWYPGTVIRMTLTKPDMGLSPAERSITIQARSVRWGNDGVGLQFVVGPPSKAKRGPEFSLDPIDGKQLDQFLKRLGPMTN